MTQAFEPGARDPKEGTAGRIADVRPEIPEYRWSRVIEASPREAASKVALSLSTKQYDGVTDLLDHGESQASRSTCCAATGTRTTPWSMTWSADRSRMPGTSWD